MARYKPYDYGQMKLLPISFERQIPRGSFEFTLNRLIDEEIDLSVGTMKKGNASAHRGTSAHCHKRNATTVPPAHIQYRVTNEAIFDTHDTTEILT